MIDPAFKTLALETASLLTGLPSHRIKIVWDKPSGDRNVVGAVEREYSQYKIMVDQALEPDQLVTAFLHELAHIFNHHISKVGCGDRRFAHIIERQETEAEELMQFWRGQAVSNSYGKTPFEMLRALKNIYSKPGGFYR